MYKFPNTFETCLSNHRKLISTISKSGSFKSTPRIVKSFISPKVQCSISFPFNPSLGVLGVFLPPIRFTLITQKRQKFQTWYFAALSNFSLEAFMPKLVSLTNPISRYWTKLRREYFQFPDFWSNPLKIKVVITPERVMILM